MLPIPPHYTGLSSCELEMHTENGFILVKYLCVSVYIYIYAIGSNSLGHSYGIDSNCLGHFYAIGNDILGRSFAIANDSLGHWLYGLFFKHAIV